MAPKEKHPSSSKFGGKPTGRPMGKPYGKPSGPSSDRPMGRGSDKFASSASADKPNSRPFNKSSGPKATFKAAPKAVDATAGERIAKVLSRRGIASRRDAEKLIEDGEVTVNGKVITSPALNVTSADVITVSGKALPEQEETRVWMYYKPEGLVTSASDEKGRDTIFDHLPVDMPRVMTIGRLDLNSEGLLLLTNDGELKRRLELPTTGWLRKYRVRINGAVDDVRLQPLRDGITIEGEKFLPMQVALDRVQGANAWVTIGLREGRNREIRRAMNAVGLYVNRLIRVSYGPFRLNDLMPGQVEEIKARVLQDQLGEAFSEAGQEPKAAPKSRAANPSARLSKPTPSTGRSRSGQGIEQSSYQSGQKLLPKPREHYHDNDPREGLRKPNPRFEKRDDAPRGAPRGERSFERGAERSFERRSDNRFEGRSERSNDRAPSRDENRFEKPRFEKRGDERSDNRFAGRSDSRSDNRFEKPRFEKRGDERSDNRFGGRSDNRFDAAPSRAPRVLNSSGTGTRPMRSESFARDTEGEENARPGRNKRFISGGTTTEAKAYAANNAKSRRPRAEEEQAPRRFGTGPARGSEGKTFGTKTFGTKSFGAKPFGTKSRDGDFERGSFDRPSGGKPSGGKSFGGKSFGAGKSDRGPAKSGGPRHDGPKRPSRPRG